MKPPANGLYEFRVGRECLVDDRIEAVGHVCPPVEVVGRPGCTAYSAKGPDLTAEDSRAAAHAHPGGHRIAEHLCIPHEEHGERSPNQSVAAEGKTEDVEVQLVRQLVEDAALHVGIERDLQSNLMRGVSVAFGTFSLGDVPRAAESAQTTEEKNRFGTYAKGNGREQL